MSESEQSSPFYQNLNRGFQFLSDSRKQHSSKSTGIPPKFNETLYFQWDIPPKIVVNVIDPVRKVSAASSSAAPLYFSRFSQYIQRKCNFRIPVSSTLIKDKTPSTTAQTSLPSSIPIQLVTNASPLTNQRNASSSSTPNIDVPEWYADPTCHVYLAPCSSLEHYKKTVKASISAFLNQIDGAMSTNLTTNSSTNNLHARQAAETAKSVVQASGHYYWSRQCILVLLPIKEGSMAHSSPTKDSNISRSMSLNDMPKKALQDKFAPDMDDASSISQNNNIPHATNLLSGLSKEMKSLYKIVANDFPSARTCILSSLGSISMEKILEGDGPIKDDSLGDGNEWTSFLQSLSDAVASGFQDRIHRYQEDLTGMDLQLSSVAQSLQKYSKKQKNNHHSNGETLEQEEDEELCSLMKRYFLVKEGLVLSYLQIHEHSEALRLYKEMDTMAVMTGKWKSQWDDSELSSSSTRIVDVAQSGDSCLFRRVLSYQKRIDLMQLYYLARQYLLSKQVQLLFLLDRPLEVLQRCIDFIEKLYSWKSRSSKAYNMGEAYLDDASQLFVEAWCVEVCWGIYSAYNQFYTWTSSKAESNRNVDEALSAAKGISDLLHFTRKRVIVISRILFSTRCAPYQASLLFVQNDAKLSSSNESTIDANSDYLKGPRQKCASRFSWVGKAFTSQAEFNSMYLRFYDSLISILYVLGYRRSTARLLIEKAQVFSLRGDIHEAASLMLKAFDKNGCSFRGWSGLSSWTYIRLSYLHREAGSSSLYMTLLINILSRATSARLPATIAHELQNDLESCVGNKELSADSFSVSPFTLNLTSDHGQCHKCCIFDTVPLTVTIQSCLPHSVTVDSLSFVTIYSDGSTDDNSSNSSGKEFAIDMGGSLVVKPGFNRYPLEWVPIFPGLYKHIKSHLYWREATFIHDKSPIHVNETLVHVKSYEPNQKIRVYPPYLFPRGTQQVSITFDSGSDDVEEATLQITCSDKVQVINNGDESIKDDFIDSSSISLGPLKPESAICHSISVQTDWQDCSEPKESVKALDIRVVSKYRHAKYPLLPQNIKDFIPTASSFVLSASIDIVGSPPFSIEKSQGFQISNGCIVINIKLSCHSTRPISLNQWSLEYPSQYHPVQEKDMNVGLFQRSLTLGDEIFLGFKCLRDRLKNDLSMDSRPILHLTYTNEHSESFIQDFVVDLDLGNPIDIASLSTTDPNEVSVALKTGAHKGVSGNPVSLMYTVVRNPFLSTLKNKNNLLKYAIHFNSDDWLVAGKLEGVIEWSEQDSYNIECVGVPMKVGSIDKYPILQLIVVEDSNLSMLSVRTHEPRSFQSLPRTEQMIVTMP